MTRQRNDSWMTAVRARAVSAGVELSEDVIRELASHLEDVYAARLAAGELDVDAREAALATLQSAVMSDLAARRRALPALQSRLVSRASAGSVLENVLLDVRYAVRMLRRSPVFATTLVAILAFSIGTIAAVVAIVDAVLLRPLPYRQPHQLVSLVRVDGNGDAGALSAADWLDYAARVSAFERLAAYANWTHNLSGDGEPLRLRSVITSGNFFEVLGRGALVGRVYTDDDDSPDAGPVAGWTAGAADVAR